MLAAIDQGMRSVQTHLTATLDKQLGVVTQNTKKLTESMEEMQRRQDRMDQLLNNTSLMAIHARMAPAGIYQGPASVSTALPLSPPPVTWTVTATSVSIGTPFVPVTSSLSLPRPVYLPGLNLNSPPAATLCGIAGLRTFHGATGLRASSSATGLRAFSNTADLCASCGTTGSGP